MSLTGFTIYIKRAGNAPTVTIETGIDLTGSVVELVLTPSTGKAPLTLSTEGDELSLALPGGVIWRYTEDLAEYLPAGRSSFADLWRVVGEVREPIGSGAIHVLVAGEGPPSESISIMVPGTQGPRGWAPVFAAVESGDISVLQIADWTGGGGDKPSVGQYLGPDGLVDDIAEATDFRGGVGLTPDISVLSTATLAPGAPATVTLDPTSTPEAPKLRFSIPRGEIGRTPDISILPTTTLAPGQPADVVLGPGSTPEEPKLAFSLPAGAQGPPGAPGEPLVLVVSDTVDTGLGGWWVTRDYHAAATCQYLRAEMLVGTATGVTLAVRKNGATVRSGIALGAGVTTITDLGLVLAKGDQVSVHREGGGTLTGPWVMLVQIDGRAP